MKEKNSYFSEYIKINGIEQYLLHYPSISSEFPILLFVHGGPGMAESNFAYAFQGNLSNLFTVVHWDQRGAGKTLTKSKKTDPMMSELLSDLLEVVRHLKDKYNKDKIVILGHSFGSVLGTLFALKYPNEVLYYIGAGQVVSIVENEKIGFERLKELIINSNNKKDLISLEKIGIYPDIAYNKFMLKKIRKIRLLQGKYNIGMDFKSIMKTMFKSPIFKISDIFSFSKGMSNNKPVWEFLLEHSLYNENTDYKVPVYYIMGERDFQAPNFFARAYFDSKNAPAKKFFMLSNAGHFMMLDQPNLFANALKEISAL